MQASARATSRCNARRTPPGDVVVHRLAEQPVAEGEAVALLDEHGAGEGVIERGQQSDHRPIEHGGQLARIERASQHRGDPYDVRFGERGEPAPQRLTEGDGRDEVVDDLGPLAGSRQRPLGLQRVNELQGEKRAAARAGQHLREAGPRPGGERGAGQGGDVSGRQRAEAEPLGSGAGQGVDQPIDAGPPGMGACDDQEDHGFGRDAVGEVGEELDRGRVRPVGVVDDQRQRPVARQIADELEQALAEAVPQVGPAQDELAHAPGAVVPGEEGGHRRPAAVVGRGHAAECGQDRRARPTGPPSCSAVPQATSMSPRRRSVAARTRLVLPMPGSPPTSTTRARPRRRSSKTDANRPSSRSRPTSVPAHSTRMGASVGIQWFTIRGITEKLPATVLANIRDTTDVPRREKAKATSVHITCARR
jgi:hypothetical protein